MSTTPSSTRYGMLTHHEREEHDRYVLVHDSDKNGMGLGKLDEGW